MTDEKKDREKLKKKKRIRGGGRLELLASEALQHGSLGTVCFRWWKQEIQGEKSVNDYRHNNWFLSLHRP